MAKKVFLLILVSLLFNSSVFAQSNIDFELGEALKTFNKTSPPMSLEVRARDLDFVFRYRNFSMNYNHAESDMHYLKLDVDNEIISLMGTGLNFKYGVTGIDWKSPEHNFSPLPTLGFKIYMAVMPKMMIYTQLSGITFGRQGHVIDSESGLNYSLQKNLAVTAGYRHVAITVRRNANVGNFQMSGPFIGIRAEF